MNTITHEQRKKIFALSRQANMNNDELHFYIHEWANVSSLSGVNCSVSQAAKIITSLETVIVKRSERHPVASRTGTITEKQFEAINTLKKILKWTDERVSGFAYHTVEKREIGDLNVIEASKVITGLRNYLIYKIKK